jgi:hypothetical protein
MKKSGDSIAVTSHVGRDILQSAQLFRTVEAAVWEYVVNALQYVDPGQRPKVIVTIDTKQRRIQIADNGRGMDATGLRHFFTMHAENLDRQRGAPGRGIFGTGKSAAFGIGTRLEVTTVREGIRNVVELMRQAIDESDGATIPTNWLVKDGPAPAVPNGTVVTIDGVSAKRMGTDPLIRLIERQLGFWRAQDPEVFVGPHHCAAWQPDIDDTKTHTFQPPTSMAEQLGDVKLTIRVARIPLPVEYRGIAITAGPANVVAMESAGVDTKEHGNYLFGEVDVPALEKPAYDGTVTAYDASRSMRLNYDHPVAAALLGFIGTSMEQVRQILVEEARQVRKQADAQRLAKEAEQIAQLLNDDLKDVNDRIGEMHNLKKRANAVANAGDDEGDDEPAFIEGTDQPGNLEEQVPIEPNGEGNGKPWSDVTGVPTGDPDPRGKHRVDETGSKGEKKRKSGGLRVEYLHLGADEERSHYDPDQSIIIINLDHAMVTAALKLDGNEASTAFRRLSYEIAMTEYAMVVAKRLYVMDPGLSGDDVLFEVRDALRRVTGRAAGLYAAA